MTKFHRSAHSRPAVLGRTVKRKPLSGAPSSHQSRIQSLHHTAEDKHSPSLRQNPSNVLKSRTHTGDRLAKTVEGACITKRDMHMHHTETSTMRAANRAGNAHPSHGLHTTPLSFEAFSEDLTVERHLLDLQRTPLFTHPSESSACSSLLSSPICLDQTPLLPRSPSKRKRSSSSRSCDYEVISSSELSYYESTPNPLTLRSSLQTATPSLIPRQNEETPPSSPSTVASLSPVTPCSSFRQFPFPRFGQPTPSNPSSLPYIPSMAYDVMSQMAKDDLFYDNAEAIRIQAELFAKAMHPPGISPTPNPPRDLLAAVPPKTPETPSGDQEESFTPRCTHTLRRRRLSRSLSLSHMQFRPYSDTEDDHSDDDALKPLDFSERMRPQRLFHKELSSKYSHPEIDIKPISADNRISPEPFVDPIPVTPPKPNISDLFEPEDDRHKPNDDDDDMDIVKPHVDSNILHTSSHATIPPVGLPVSISGGFLQAAKSIVHASKQCSMSAASIMLNCPKKRVREPRRNYVKARVREKQFASRISACLPMTQNNLVAHAVHTTNLASNDPRERKQSTRSLVRELRQARRLGIPTLVFHLGSNKTQRPEIVQCHVAASIRKILSKVDDMVLAIETMTHRCEGETSHSIDGLAELIGLVDMPGRLKVCIDLCHTLQQFDITTGVGRYEFMAAAERLGPENIAAVHVSDSYYPHGVEKDRHANLCFGVIPIDAFRSILRHPYFRHIPVILETPAYFPALRQSTHKGLLATARRLERLRALDELEFFVHSLLLHDLEWADQGVTLIAEWKRQKREIEDRIRKVVYQIGGATLRRWAEQRERINSDIQRARWFRGEAVFPDDASHGSAVSEDLVLRTFLLDVIGEDEDEKKEKKEEKEECCC